MDAIGDRLRWAREQQVWTQVDLAERSGVPKVTISRIENGHHQGRPRQSTIHRLADALGVEAGWLMFGEAWEGKEAA